MRFHANLNCDKLWISYAGCSSISPRRTACKMRKYFRKAHIVYLSQEKPFALTLKEKSPSLLWGFSPSLLHSPGVVVGSIRPISDCTAPLGTVGSLLRAQKRRAMNSRSCLSRLPEPAGVLCRVSQTQHEKCLLLQHSGALMKQCKFNRALINALHFLTKTLQNTDKMKSARRLVHAWKLNLLIDILWGWEMESWGGKTFGDITSLFSALEEIREQK